MLLHRQLLIFSKNRDQWLNGPMRKNLTHEKLFFTIYSKEKT